jgi:hypothetical protein
VKIEPQKPTFDQSSYSLGSGVMKVVFRSCLTSIAKPDYLLTLMLPNPRLAAHHASCTKHALIEWATYSTLLIFRPAIDIRELLAM